MTPRSVTVAVLVHREPFDTVKRALVAVGAQVYDGPVELLVIGPPTRPEVAELVSRLSGRFVPEASPSIGRRRALAVSEASCDFVAFTDADCVAHQDWVAQLVEAATRHSFTSGAFGVTNHDPGRNLTYRAAQSSGLLTGFTLARQAPFFQWAPCSNLLVRRHQALGVGNFDETLHRAAEDVEFGVRLTSKYGPLAGAPDAVVDHDHGAFARGIWRRARLWGGGDVDLLRRLPGIGRPSPPPASAWLALALLAATLLTRGWVAPLIVAAVAFASELLLTISSGRGALVGLTANALSEVQDVSRRVAAVVRGPRSGLWRQPVFGVGHARVSIPTWNTHLRMGSFVVFVALVTGVVLR